MKLRVVGSQRTAGSGLPLCGAGSGCTRLPRLLHRACRRAPETPAQRAAHTARNSHVMLTAAAVVAQQRSSPDCKQAVGPCGKRHPTAGPAPWLPRCDVCAPAPSRHLQATGAPYRATLKTARKSRTTATTRSTRRTTSSRAVSAGRRARTAGLAGRPAQPAWRATTDSAGPAAGRAWTRAPRAMRHRGTTRPTPRGLGTTTSSRSTSGQTMRARGPSPCTTTMVRQPATLCAGSIGRVSPGPARFLAARATPQKVCCPCERGGHTQPCVC